MDDDVQRFRDLFHAHYNDVLRFAQRRVNDAEDAAEIAADVFRVAWQRFDPHRLNGRAWLFTIARNLVLEHYRRTGRREAAHLRAADAALTLVPAADATGTESHAAAPVIDALDLLPADTRELLRLRYWEQLEPAEIATVLDIAPGTVRVRLHRARMQLRGLLPDRLRSEGARS